MPAFDLALPLSLAWTGPVDCGVANVDSTSGVGFGDFALIAGQWQEEDCSESGWCQGADLNRSGAVDIADIAIIGWHWLGQDCSD